MKIEIATQTNLEELLGLYAHLHGEALHPDAPEVQTAWWQMQNTPGLSTLLAWQGDALVGSCTVAIVPNLTHAARPYALIENVITHPQHRRQGVATALLAYAKQLAQKADCYKLMLLSSLKSEGAAQLYKKAGFTQEDKTAFVQWLA